MGTQSGVLVSTLLISTVTFVSVIALSGCTQVDERIYPTGHYDSYYGTPLKKAVNRVPKKIAIKATAPKKYIVKKRDTLWSISKKFLVQPWYWPEIWDKNQKIQNPHLIYPGDVLYLTFVKNNSGKLVPRIRIDRGNRHQPVSSLIPFLAWPKVLDANTINNAPYIVGSRDDHNLIADGERVYVKNLKASKKGDRYGIFHKEKELIDPETGKNLGFEVDYMAYARVDRSDALSTVHIISSKREVRRGDRLFKPVDETQGLNIPIHAPDKKVRGTVVSLFDANSISGRNMIAVINRGKQQGIEVGHTLGVYSDGKTVTDVEEEAKAKAALERFRQEQRKDHPFGPDKKVKPLPSFDIQVELPPERVATVVIYKVTNKVSFGLIVESERAVRNGDKIGNP